VPVPQPAQVIVAQRARVVLQLDQVQPPPAQDQQVDLVPFALPVPELEVAPGAERGDARQDRPRQRQTLRLMRELGVTSIQRRTC
jgi:hypothetical protein